MSYVSAEFQDSGSVLSALRNLKESGLSPGDLDVYSDVPLEIPRNILERRTHMSLGVVLGQSCSAFLLSRSFLSPT